MKIAFVFPSFYPVDDTLPTFYNGLETRDYFLAKWFDKQGYDVGIFGPVHSRLNDFNGKIYQGSPLVGTTPLNTMQLENITVLKTKSDLKKYDIIHDDTHFKQVYRYKKFLNSNKLCFTWDHHPDNLQSFPSIDQNIIYISQWQKEAIQKKFGLSKNIGHLIYPGLNTEFYSHFKKNDEEKIYHLFLSRLSQVKGPHLVLELAKEFRDEEFVIIGDILFTQENYYAWAMKKEADQMPNCKMIFNASFDEKIYYLNRAKSYLHLALWKEPFGLTMLEGMFFGAPVFALNPGGGVDEIVDNSSGMKSDIVANQSLDIRKQLIGPFAEFLNRINQYNPEQRVDDFTFQKTAEGYEKYFNELNI